MQILMQVSPMASRPDVDKYRSAWDALKRIPQREGWMVSPTHHPAYKVRENAAIPDCFTSILAQLRRRDTLSSLASSVKQKPEVIDTHSHLSRVMRLCPCRLCTEAMEQTCCDWCQKWL